MREQIQSQNLSKIPYARIWHGRRAHYGRNFTRLLTVQIFMRPVLSLFFMHGTQKLQGTVQVSVASRLYE